MNYETFLHKDQPLAPNGGWLMFVGPVIWLIVAFVVIAFAGYASIGPN